MKTGLLAGGLSLGILAPLTSCATVHELQDVDRCARLVGSRTIVLEDELSLYSPYEPVPTRMFLEEIKKQKREVFALLDVQSTEPVIVWLQPNAGMGMDQRVEGNLIFTEGLRFEPHGGLHGVAGDRFVILQVAPSQVLRLEDGREISSFLGESMYTQTIRHEMIHIATNLLGVRGGDWLREGIAHAVGSIPVADGCLDLDPVPEILRAAAALPRESRSLDRLLAWRQSFPPVEDDRSARALSCSLVAFLLQREPELDLGAGVLRLDAMDEQRIRSLEATWSAWLDAFPTEPAPEDSSDELDTPL